MGWLKPPRKWWVVLILAGDQSKRILPISMVNSCWPWRKQSSRNKELLLCPKIFLGIFSDTVGLVKIYGKVPVDDNWAVFSDQWWGLPSLKQTVCTWKLVLGILVSLWDGLFSRAFAVSFREAKPGKTLFWIRMNWESRMKISHHFDPFCLEYVFSGTCWFERKRVENLSKKVGFFL